MTDADLVAAFDRFWSALRTVVSDAMRVSPGEAAIFLEVRKLLERGAP